MKGSKPFILLFLFIIFTKFVIGQTGIITGTIVESGSDEPLPYANVALFIAIDSSNVLKGATSAEDGKFIFESIPEGKYFISAAGLKPFHIAMAIRQGAFLVIVILVIIFSFPEGSGPGDFCNHLKSFFF